MFAQEESAAGSVGGESGCASWQGDPEFCQSKGGFLFSYIYIYTLKGSFYLAFSERAGSGGQRELYLEGLGRFAVWMLSQQQGFVYGSIKGSALSVTGVVPTPCQ